MLAVHGISALQKDQKPHKKTKKLAIRSEQAHLAQEMPY